MTRLLSVAAALLCAFQDPPKTVLRACWGGPPEHLDPARIATLHDARYAYALLEGLVTFGEDNATPVPGLAEKWTVSADGLTYSFVLRAAKWSDGKDVTAHDVVASWRRALHPDTAGPFAELFEILQGARAFREGARVDAILREFAAKRGEDRLSAAREIRAGARKRHVAAIQGVLARENDVEIRKFFNDAVDLAEKRPDTDLGITAVDDRTVGVGLERPAPHFLALTGFVPFLPVPMHARAWTTPDGFVGSGPYVLADRSREEIVLERNPKYRERLGPDRVVISLIEEPSRALALYDEGRLDWLEVEAVPMERLGELAERKDFHAYDTFGTFLLRFNATKPQFAGAAVRRAFALATDKAAPAEIERGTPCDSLVPAGFAGYAGPKGLAFDAKTAMESFLSADLDPADFPRTELLVPESPGMIAVGHFLVEGWEKTLGLKVALRRAKWNAYVRSVETGAYDLAIGAWGGDYGDPLALLENWTSESPANLTGWVSKKYDDLLRAASAESDAKKRYAILAQAESVLLEEEAAVVPLYRMRSWFLAKENVKGLTPNLLGRFLLRNVRVD